ncbi:MAG: outer membrane protein/protective antigen [Acidobacteria bacterium]|nr:outer membrane protein/protective antigen [Acidobacteriota bacterium]
MSLLAPARLLAQESAPAADRVIAERFFQPTLDAGDLWHVLRHGRADPLAGDAGAAPPPTPSRDHFFVVAPTIASKPSTGLSAGLNSNLAFFRGNENTTHISSVSAGLRVSQKKQVLSGIRFSMFTADDRWFISGDNRLSWTSQNTYGLGTDTLAIGAGVENVKFNAFKLYETAYRHVGPHLFAGLGVNFSTHSNIRPGDGVLSTFEQSDYAAYNDRHGFSDSRQTSSGTTAGLLFDTRDNGINAQRGWLANAVVRTFFDGFLGGDSTWQQMTLDVRTYRKLTADGRQKLAFWFMSDNVISGTAPYLDLPATGSDGRSARGYSDGRYRGEHLAYGEMEYRGTVTRNGLLGVVVFVNTTTVDNEDAGKKLFDDFAPAAGFGLRVLLNKHSRTNLTADYGWGKEGSRGLYLGIQEAF